VEKIVIEEKQSKTLRWMALSFILVIVSLVLWILGMRERRTLLWLTGFIAFVSFTLRLIVLMGKALQKKPLITITFDGIIDSSDGGSVGYIPFLDIESFCIVKLPEGKVIGVLPKDEHGFIEKLSPNKQRIARANLSMNYPPFSLRVENAKDMSLEDIFTLLKKRLDDYSSLYD